MILGPSYSPAAVPVRCYKFDADQNIYRCLQVFVVPLPFDASLSSIQRTVATMAQYAKFRTHN
jgi:hypothetical protein